MKYSVTMWGSNPSENNDDSYYGWDFESRFEAVQKFTEQLGSYDAPFVEVSGPDIYKVERTKAKIDPPGIDREWQYEIAREEGMLHGIDAYNDVMGY